MATTNIELDIENITGVADANDQFVISAQKFVVASVPKELMHFATKKSSDISNANGLAMPVDTVIDVQRNGYSCKQIALSDSKWAAETGSLKKATAKHPVWWYDSAVIKILPDPDGSNLGNIYYIDFSEVDDDSDLRNAVIMYACSKEFSKLGVDNLPSWSSINAPIAPSLSANTVSFSTTAPVFTPPVMESPDWSDVENWITTEEDSEMLASRIQAIQSQIGEYSARMAEAQADFNEKNTEYQAQLQISLQNAQLSDSSDAQSLQKYQAELQEYQNDVNKELNKLQNVTYYQNESKKYYEWAKMEINSYIQNNSKMMATTIAAQAQQQQRG
jgi:hypothetical protein